MEGHSESLNFDVSERCRVVKVLAIVVQGDTCSKKHHPFLIFIIMNPVARVEVKGVGSGGQQYDIKSKIQLGEYWTANRAELEHMFNQGFQYLALTGSENHPEQQKEKPRQWSNKRNLSPKQEYNVSDLTLFSSL